MGPEQVVDGRWVAVGGCGVDGRVDRWEYVFDVDGCLLRILLRFRDGTVRRVWDVVEVEAAGIEEWGPVGEVVL